MAVYFIADPKNQLVKIGLAKDPKARLRNLQTANGNPLRMLCVIPGDATTEKEMHRRFAHTRAHGEWFHASGELAVFVTDHTPWPTIGFSEWLERHERRDTPIGDLARDVKRDRDWPKNEDNLDRLIEHLQRKNACEEAIGVLYRAWSDWSLSEMDALPQKRRRP